MFVGTGCTFDQILVYAQHRRQASSTAASIRSSEGHQANNIAGLAHLLPRDAVYQLLGDAVMTEQRPAGKPPE
jgi:hypothetical protein